MAVRGIFASDAGQVGDRVANGGFSRALIEYKAANTAPLLAIFGANVVKDYASTEYQWMETQRFNGINYVVANGGSPLGNNLRFADASWVGENMIFLVVPTGEYLFVTGVAGNIVTVVRGFGNNVVLPIAPSASSNVMVQRIGTAFHEGSERPEAFMTHSLPRSNLTQIFRNSWAVTRTAKMVRRNSGDLVRKAKMDCAMMHMEDIESSMLWGIRSSGVQNNQPIRSMDGLYRQIRTNIGSPAGGILTEKMLNTFFQVVFANGIKGKPNNTRIAICGMSFIRHITELVRASTQYSITEQTNAYGLNITTWITPFGTVRLLPHDRLSNTPGRSSDLIVVHPSAINLFFMYEGEEMESIMNGGNSNGVDAEMGGLISELTMAVEGELACGILTGTCDTAPTPYYTASITPYEPPRHTGC